MSGLLEDTNPADEVILEFPSVKIHKVGRFQSVMVHIKNPKLQKYTKCKLDFGDDVAIGPHRVLLQGPWYSKKFGTKVLIPASALVPV